MKTLKITSKELKETEYYCQEREEYYKEYIGKENLSCFDGNLEIASFLGCIKFKRIIVSGYIHVGEYSYIETDEGIEANLGIETHSNIKAGSYILAGNEIKSHFSIEVGSDIEVSGMIKVGWDINAGGSIKSSWGIEVGGNIKAGGDIEAVSIIATSIRSGGSIKTDLGIATFCEGGIKAKKQIKTGNRGIISSGMFSREGEQIIEAEEVIGKVIYGKVNLLENEQENNKNNKRVKIKLANNQIVEGEIIEE